MKKFLSLLLSALMILSVCVIASAVDTITVDGKFDEAAWLGNNWTTVDSTNGAWQTPLTSGETRNETYDFQFRADSTNLYVAVKCNFNPIATDAKFGNGSGTNFRLWTFVDGSQAGGVDYTTYNYIINYAYKPSGDALSVLHNTNPTGNTGAAVTINGLTAISTKGDGYWYIEMAIPFAEIGATTSAHFYTTVSSPLTNDGTTVTGNNALSYGPFSDHELIGNAEAPYKAWDKTADIDVTFANIALGSAIIQNLPTGALAIDNFGDYVGSTSTIISRVSDKTTIGEISAVTYGSAKDYNYFYLAAVDSNGVVTEINQKLGRKVNATDPILGEKDSFVVPENGYVLLCNATPGGDHTQAVIDQFKTIAVGDVVALYNVNLKSLSTAAVKANLNQAGFASRRYTAGINNFSNATQIGVGDLSLLTDGNKVSDAGAWPVTGAVLIQDKVCTDAAINPAVDLVLNLGSAKIVDKVLLNLYHNYDVMIGLPKNNRIILSYSNDGVNYTRLGLYTFEGVAATGTRGTIEATLDIPDVSAKYIGISYDIGPSPFATKVVWEFTSLTEAGIVERLPEVVYGTEAPNTTGEATNVALNKDWSGIDYHSAIPTYSGDFTDGVFAAEGAGFSYGAPWFSFYRNGDKGNINYSLYGEAIIDVGTDGTGLGGVRMQVAPAVGAATWIKVYASGNGIAWDEVGTLAYDGTAIQWTSCTFAKTINARYIKVGIQNAGMFFMVSEIEVIKYAPVVVELGDAASTGTVPGNVEANIVSVSKTYEIISDGGERDSYIIDGVVLTDGLKHGGEVGGGFGLNVPYAEFILDLGESNTKLYKFGADLIGGAWGIAEPNGITITVSDDGVTYYNVGSSTTKTDNFFVVELDHTISARYIKFACDAGSHVWLSEIEAYEAVLPEAASSGNLPSDSQYNKVSLNKSYEIIYVAGGQRDDGYAIDATVLTDGTNHGGDLGSGRGINAPRANFILDLGEVNSNLYKFGADLIGGDWGIAEPNGISIEISEDGINYYAVGSSTERTDNFFIVELDHTVAARYIKFVCDAGSHVWLSEIEAYEAVEAPVESEVSDDVSEDTSSETTTPETSDPSIAIYAIAFIAMLGVAAIVIKRRKV
ncbi:MAG: hypothetical protein A2Y17_00935 [Clostridiales bacterium GWF2_38_85]|nr:MAG: hypothetical protein A2Y17_00935 [Clostridiales bacterium GWF2_38_85]HBL84542.1 hypothetical protein [Clostridiales bacterium]